MKTHTIYVSNGLHMLHDLVIGTQDKDYIYEQIHNGFRFIKRLLIKMYTSKICTL